MNPEKVQGVPGTSRPAAQRMRKGYSPLSGIPRAGGGATRPLGGVSILFQYPVLDRGSQLQGVPSLLLNLENELPSLFASRLRASFHSYI